MSVELCVETGISSAFSSQLGRLKACTTPIYRTTDDGRRINNYMAGTLPTTLVNSHQMPTVRIAAGIPKRIHR